MDSVAINHFGTYLTVSLQSLFEKQPEPSIANPDMHDVQKVGYLIQLAHGEVQAMH